MTTFNNAFDHIDDADDTPEVVCGQVFLHPDRGNYIVITEVKNSYARFVGFDHDGTVLRGRAGVESLIEGYAVPSIEELVNMDKETKQLLESHCGTILTQGCQ